MNNIFVNILHFVAILVMSVLILFWCSMQVAEAASIPAVYTNENFWTSPHDQPVSFSRDAAGNFSGRTLTGKIFTQTAVVTDLNIRLHRFAIDEAFFYISNRGIIIAPTDLAATSIYLNRSAA